MDFSRTNPFTDQRIDNQNNVEGLLNQEWRPLMTEQNSRDSRGASTELPSEYEVLSSVGSETTGSLVGVTSGRKHQHRTEGQQAMPSGSGNEYERPAGRQTNPFILSLQEDERTGPDAISPYAYRPGHTEHRQDNTQIHSGQYHPNYSTEMQTDRQIPRGYRQQIDTGVPYKTEEESRNTAQFPGKANVTPPQYDGSTSWDDYAVQFELIAELNNWPEAAKALYLAASLKGQARAILSDLDSSRRRSYRALTEALGRRFSPANQTQLFRAMLKNRQRQPAESLTELAQDIKRLALKAYPDAPYEMVETLAKEYFVDSLGDTETRWRVYQSRPVNLSDAVTVAVELEAFHLAEVKKGNLKRPTARAVIQTEKQEDKVERQMQLLGENLAKTMEHYMSKIHEELASGNYRKQTFASGQDRNMSWRDRDRPPLKCWGCGKFGHIKRNCREPYQEDTTGKSYQGNEKEPDLRVEGRQ